jgi:1-acyl-sn-glycerol-3-phosphate acyltransferase
MFPEGNIFREGCVQPLKPGMARIALQAAATRPGMDLAIVPISIRYSNPIPHWRCDVTVTIGTPIKVVNYCTKSVKRSTQQLTHELEAALKEVNQEKLSPDALPVLTSSETVLL